MELRRLFEVLSMLAFATHVYSATNGLVLKVEPRELTLKEGAGGEVQRPRQLVRLTPGRHHFGGRHQDRARLARGVRR